MSPIKITVLGDTHGNIIAALGAIRAARDNGSEFIVQCGDFGLWTHRYEGIYYLDTINEGCEKLNVFFVWLDGNHENHDHLQHIVQSTPKTTNGHHYLRSRVLYSPRGNAWTWGHKRFMTVGGAVSIDKDWRRAEEGAPRTLWWPGEQLTDIEAADIKAEALVDINRGKPVDYFFSHDCSNQTPFKYRLKPDLDSVVHRQRMDSVVDTVKPKFWFHGHMHERYDWHRPIIVDGTWDGHTATHVYGLECDGMKDNWGILDTSDDSFTFATDLDKPPAV